MEEKKPFTKLTEVSAPYRSIPKSSVEKYGTRTGIDKDGKHVYRVYPYPHGEKLRILPKDFSQNGGFKNSHLFGMDKFNAGSSPHITIVEGEDDVPSAYYMLGEKHPVVGIPGASISGQLLQQCHEYLNSFKQIIVCTDADDAGNKAADRLANAFPNKVYRVKMTTHKDPNEFLAAGHEKEFFWAWQNREKYVPSGIFNTPSQFKDILRLKESNSYVPTAISDLNDVIKGLMQGHLTVLTGPEGQGKTEVMRRFEYDILTIAYLRLTLRQLLRTLQRMRHCISLTSVLMKTQ
jgi:DNA primase